MRKKDSRGGKAGALGRPDGFAPAVVAGSGTVVVSERTETGTMLARGTAPGAVTPGLTGAAGVVTVGAEVVATGGLVATGVLAAGVLVAVVAAWETEVVAVAAWRFAAMSW